MEEMEKSHESFLQGTQMELRKEMALLQKKIMMDTVSASQKDFTQQSLDIKNVCFKWPFGVKCSVRYISEITKTALELEDFLQIVHKTILYLNGKFASM